MAESNNEAVASNPSSQHMTCMEVWGGSQLTTQGVEMGVAGRLGVQQALR